MYVKTPVGRSSIFVWPVSLVNCVSENKVKSATVRHNVLDEWGSLLAYYYMNYIATLLKRNCTVILVFSYFCLFLLYVFSIFFQLLSHLWRNKVVSVVVGNESMPKRLLVPWADQFQCYNINIFFKQNTRKQFYQTSPGNYYSLKLRRCWLQLKK